MGTTPEGLGTLGWHPAADRRDLLAAVVAAALDRGGIDAGSVYAAPIDPALSDTEAFCEAYTVPLERTVNCVIVRGRRQETVKTAAVLVRGVDRADVNKRVRKRLDVRKLSFAPQDEAVAETGMEYGGIGPIGLPAGWPVLVDAAVASCPWVVIGSGIRGSKLALPGGLLGALPGAEVFDLAL
jgi:prolyl-tRNA editing enzyme YbaK/EbsC (Cys-tRNA(Pro) deacylase)